MSNYKIKYYTTFFAFIVSFNCLHADLTSGLVAWYPFDGNASDMSGNGNDGTVFGATLSTDRHDVDNMAYIFDGNDWIELPHESLLNENSNLSISAWYSFANGAEEGQIIASGDYRGGNDPIHMRLGPNGSTQLSFNNIATATDFSSLTGKWYHFVSTLGSHNGISQLNIYIDGKVIASSEKSLEVISYDKDMPTLIGALEGRPFYSMPGQFFNGSLDEIRIYDRTLSATEVNALYEIEKTNEIDLNSGLVAYYPFDGNASDMSGNGNDGTVFGATLSTDRHGQNEKAYYYDGINDWIEVNDHESFNFESHDPFSISVWVKASQLKSRFSPRSVIEKWSGPQGYPFVIRAYEYGGSKTLAFARYDGNQNPHALVEDDSLLNAYGQVIAVSNGNEMKIYFNGSLKDSITFELGDTQNSSNLFFGKRGSNDEFFNGYIDDVRLYNRALNSDETKALYELENLFQPSSGADLEIIQAIYGATDRTIDVTSIISKRIVGNQISLNITNSIMGEDPAPGVVKNLIVRYLLDASFYKVEIPENGLLSIPNTSHLKVEPNLSDILVSPESFGLMISSEFNASLSNQWSEAFNAGIESVINDPYNYSLISLSNHEQALEDAIMQSRSEGIAEGKIAVFNDPNSYSLVTLSTHEQALLEANQTAEKAIEELMKSLESNATLYTPSWFYVPDHGWMWSNNNTYPWFYDQKSMAWMYFKAGQGKPNFYHYETKKWMILE